MATRNEGTPLMVARNTEGGGDTTNPDVFPGLCFGGSQFRVLRLYEFFL